MKTENKLTPYQRIMNAAKRGTGLRLSAKEVWQLSYDTAISDAAKNDTDSKEALEPKP